MPDDNNLDIFKEHPVRYATESGEFLARGTGYELAVQVAELRAALKVAIDAVAYGSNYVPTTSDKMMDQAYRRCRAALAKCSEGKLK